MNLLLIAATEFEIAPFLQEMKSKPYDIEVLIGGVGMTAMAYSLGKHLSKKKYDAIVNVGIGGSFNKENELGALIRVQSDCFSELGAQNGQNFLSIDEMGFGKSLYYENAGPFLNLPSVLKLKSSKGITVNTVHGNEDSIAGIAKRLNPEVESMEGAAVFYAAQQNGIYSLQIRAISNFVETRNRSGWQIDLAIKNLNNWIIEFTNELFSEITQN